MEVRGFRLVVTLLMASMVTAQDQDCPAENVSFEVITGKTIALNTIHTLLQHSSFYINFLILRLIPIFELPFNFIFQMIFA